MYRLQVHRQSGECYCTDNNRKWNIPVLEETGEENQACGGISCVWGGWGSSASPSFIPLHACMHTSRRCTFTRAHTQTQMSETHISFYPFPFFLSLSFSRETLPAFVWHIPLHRHLKITKTFPATDDHSFYCHLVESWKSYSTDKRILTLFLASTMLLHNNRVKQSRENITK